MSQAVPGALEAVSSGGSARGDSEERSLHSASGRPYEGSFVIVDADTGLPHSSSHKKQKNITAIMCYNWSNILHGRQMWNRARDQTRSLSNLEQSIVVPVTVELVVAASPAACGAGRPLTCERLPCQGARRLRIVRHVSPPIRVPCTFGGRRSVALF